MKEWCLLNKAGGIVNMAKVYTGKAPMMLPEHESKGYRWVPIEQVPQGVLRTYRFWDERP